jgi:hypothetical protein
MPWAWVRASALTSLRDILSTLKASTAANHEIYFVSPSGVALNSNVTLTFPAGFTIGSVAFGDIDVAIGSSGTCESATYTEATVAASPAASTWGAAFSGQVLTLSAPSSGGATLPAGRCLRIRIGTNASTGGAGANQIVNQSTPALYAIAIAGGFGDTGDISFPILSNDQVSVSASVPQALTFSLSSTTIGFGNLSTTQVKFATNDNAGTTTQNPAHNLQASTNSVGGYVITVKGATLTYGTSTIDAIGASNTAIATGTEQFGVRYSASGGSGSVTAPYAASGFAYAADATTTSQIASSAGASNNTTYNATYVANIAGLTEAGTYTTALTYVATATY